MDNIFSLENSSILYHIILTIFYIFYFIYNLQDNSDKNKFKITYTILTVIFIYGNTLMCVYSRCIVSYYSQHLELSILAFMTSLSFYASSIFYIKNTLNRDLGIFLKYSVYLLIILFIFQNIDDAKFVISDQFEEWRWGYNTLLPSFLYFLRYWGIPLIFILFLITGKNLNKDDVEIRNIMVVILYSVFIAMSFVLVISYSLFDVKYIHPIIDQAIIFYAVIRLMYFYSKHENLLEDGKTLIKQIENLVIRYRIFMIAWLVIGYCLYYIKIDMIEVISPLTRSILELILSGITVKYWKKIETKFYKTKEKVWKKLNT